MPYNFKKLPWLAGVLEDFVRIDCAEYTRKWNEGSDLPPDGFFPVDPEKVFVMDHMRDQAKAAVIGGIDVPVLISGENGGSRGCIALVGLDPLRNPKHFTQQMSRGETIFVGTPYAVHCDKYVDRTRVYRVVIDDLLREGFDVYLTDTNKTYLANGDKIVTFTGEAKKRCINILKNELSEINPVLTVCMGAVVKKVVPSNVETLELPHLSCSCCWNAAMKLMGKPGRTNIEGRAREFFERVMAKIDEA